MRSNSGFGRFLGVAEALMGTVATIDNSNAWLETWQQKVSCYVFGRVIVH